jgi:S1-C subfamily serine protease
MQEFEEGMSRRLIVLVVCLVAVGTRAARGDDAALAQALALQKVIGKVIAKTEPAIACILVSRSQEYLRDGQGPDKDHPGRLGKFDPDSVRPGLKDSARDVDLRKRKLDMAGAGYMPQSFGSGVVIDAAGLVLTNYHVIQDATKIFVRLPGGKGSYANIHAADPRSDLAVLELIAPPLLKTIALGDADRLEKGQFVLTLANPFAAGFRDGQPSASWGILSNIRRRSLNHLREEERVKPLHYYATLLQTDARLHLGCSGGALLNLQGEMVGLLTAVAAIQGGETPGGFAIPINTGMRRIIDVLKRGEEVDYGFLGVTVKEEGTNGPGVGIRSVVKGSPADVDGNLKENDVLLAVNGQPLVDVDDVFTTIGTHLAGTKVRLLVRRGPREWTAEVALAKLYVPGTRIVSSLANRPWRRGLRVDYNSLLSQQPPRLFSIPPGVLISDIQSNSASERAMLKTGDIVVQVNQQPVSTPAAFYQALDAAAGPVELRLYDFQQEPRRVILK